MSDYERKIPRSKQHIRLEKPKPEITPVAMQANTMLKSAPLLARQYGRQPMAVHSWGIKDCASIYTLRMAPSFLSTMALTSTKMGRLKATIKMDQLIRFSKK